MEEEEDLDAILPLPAEILDTVEKWRRCYKAIEGIVKTADKIIEARENRKKDQGEWKYQSYYQCSNELCPKTAKDSYEHFAHGNICIDCFPRRKSILKRTTMYETETWKHIEERSSKEKEWYWLEYRDGKVTLEDIKCLFGSNTCWFYGNMDRLQDYTGLWMLRGTDDVGICNVCWSNSGRNANAVVRHIRWEYETEADKAKEKDRQYKA